MGKKCWFKSKLFWFTLKYFFQADISTEDISDYWKLLQNFSSLPDWPFPVGKFWFQWNSFPKKKSFFGKFLSNPYASTWTLICLKSQPQPEMKWEDVCGRQGVNTENSVFPREGCASSNLLKPGRSGSGVSHKGWDSASSTVHPKFAHTADGLMPMGVIVRWGGGRWLSPFPPLSLHARQLCSAEQKGLSLLLSWDVPKMLWYSQRTWHGCVLVVVGKVQEVLSLPFLVSLICW